MAKRKLTEKEHSLVVEVIKTLISKKYKWIVHVRHGYTTERMEKMIKNAKWNNKECVYVRQVVLKTRTDKGVDVRFSLRHSFESGDEVFASEKQYYILCFTLEDEERRTGRKQLMKVELGKEQEGAELLMELFKKIWESSCNIEFENEKCGISAIRELL